MTAEAEPVVEPEEDDGLAQPVGPSVAPTPSVAAGAWDDDLRAERTGGRAAAPLSEAPPPDPNLGVVEQAVQAVQSDLLAMRENVESVIANLPFDAKFSLEKPQMQPVFDVLKDGMVGEVPDFRALLHANDHTIRDAMVRLLLAATEEAASDLHLCAGVRPFMRRHGSIVFLSDDILTAPLAERLNLIFMDADHRQYFEHVLDYEFALALDGLRYRVSMMMTKDGVAATYRIIYPRIRTLEELGFANGGTILDLLAHHNGLILVAGPVGCGKTTTLSALVDSLNRSRNDHIITVEDPIEMVHVSRNCNITQREVGVHTKSFSSALKGALREDPDVIVIGELRDLETIELAITASETGHLVIGTLHTADAATTVNLLLDVFPPQQQAQIRAMVAESLRGVICQRLVPTADDGVTVACEMLLNNLAVGNLIRENKMHALRDVMMTNYEKGMCLMDFYLQDLFRRGVITEAVARQQVDDPGLVDSVLAEQAAAAEPKKKRRWR
jgi:twitching motility protein PilT